MSTYFFPIKVAFITFPLIAFMLTIPFLIVQYRKYGYLNKLRAVVLYSLLLYLLVAFYLVILPLPKTRDVKSIQRPDTVHYNLKPFQFIQDLKKETKIDISRPSTFKFILTERAFLQAFFNILLLLPLGVYLRYYFSLSLRQTIISSFFVSLFFELTQLSGLYGIYNAPYRLFDVDDLFLNTLGSTIGYYLTPLFTFFLPKSDKLDENIDLKTMPVSYTRRFVAFTIDRFIIDLIPGVSSNIVIYLSAYIFYYLVFVYFTNGKTIGLFLTSLKIKGLGENITFKEIFLRNSSIYLLVIGLAKALDLLIEYNQTTSLYPYLIIIKLCQISFNIIIFIHFGIRIIKKERFFYEEYSNTRVVIDKK